MKRVLKNHTKLNLVVNFRGREINFGPKQSRTFDMTDEEEAAKYHFWRTHYEFLVDITANCEVK